MRQTIHTSSGAAEAPPAAITIVGMSESALLALVAAHPHPRALARRAGEAPLFTGLRRLERAGLVSRRRGLYRITRRGRDELALERALSVRVTRALAG